MPQKGHAVDASHPAWNPDGTLDETAWAKWIWETKAEISASLDEVRRTAYRIAGYRWHRRWDSVAPPPASPDMAVPSTPAELIKWSAEVVKFAGRLQAETQNVRKPDAPKVIEITARAGQLLGWVELLMAGYRQMLEPTSGSTARGRLELLSHAMTVVISAKDQVLSARGHSENLIARSGSFELNILLLVAAGVFVIYGFFHPLWGLRPFPLSLRPSYEIVFWSIFGALAMSAIIIANETMQGKFEPSLMFKYFYKVPLAPLVAYILIVFFGLSGGALSGVSGTVISLDPATANYSALIILAFLFGFFSKRSLEILDTAWTSLIKPAAAGTTETGEGETGAGGTTKAGTQAPGGAKPGEGTKGGTTETPPA